MLTRFSERDSIQRTGRRSRWASSAATSASEYTPPLAPNPPPTQGARTLTAERSIPRVRATSPWTPKTLWVEIHTVSEPSGSGRARTAFGSMVTGATRLCRSRGRRHRFRVGEEVVVDRVVVAPHDVRPVGGEQDGGGLGRGIDRVDHHGKRVDRRPRPARRRPRRRPGSRRGRRRSTRRRSGPGPWRAAGAPAPGCRPWAARPARPPSRRNGRPGFAAVADVSTERTRPCAAAERTNTASSTPGAGRSATNCAVPVSSSGSSDRRTSWPSRLVVVPGSAVSVTASCLVHVPLKISQDAIRAPHVARGPPCSCPAASERDRRTLAAGERRDEVTEMPDRSRDQGEGLAIGRGPFG